MTRFDRALQELVQCVEHDHWLVALALSGTDAELPADAELAALVETVRNGRGTTWSELFELHPCAVERHTAWATSQQTRTVIDPTPAPAPLAA